MRTSTLLLTILLTSTCLTQMLGSRFNGPRHSSTTKRPENPPQKNTMDVQHAKIIEFVSKIRNINKSLEQMKKRQKFLNNQIKDGVLKKRQIRSRVESVKNFQKKIDSTKKTFGDIFKTYSNLLQKVNGRINREGKKLNNEERKIQKSLEEAKFQAKKHNLNFENIKKNLNEAKNKWRNKVKETRNKIKNKSEQLNESKDTLKKLMELIKTAQEMKNNQKKLEVFSELRNNKNYAMTKISKELDNVSTFIAPLPANMPTTEKAQKEKENKEKYMNMMKCVHSFKEHVELLRREITEGADLTETFVPSEACKSLNKNIGLGENGCFRVAVEDFTKVAKVAKSMLSVEALTNFEAFRKNIQDATEVMKKDIREKCVDNVELQRTNMKCAETIKKIFEGIVSNQNTDGYMNYIEMNEQLENMMEHDFWMKVHEDCNK